MLNSTQISVACFYLKLLLCRVCHVFFDILIILARNVIVFSDLKLNHLLLQ